MSSEAEAVSDPSPVGGGARGRAGGVWPLPLKLWAIANAPSLAASRVRSTGVAVVAILLCCYPLANAGNGFILDIGTDMLLWGTLALGLNAVLGWTGLLDIGYIAFFAIGGYTYAILAGDGIMSFWPSLIVGVGISAIAALIIGLPSLRLHSDYLAIMTLGFGEIVYIAAQNLNGLTGGNDGLYSYPSPQIGSFVFDSPLRFYFLALGLAAVALIANKLVRSTKLARRWLLLRGDEIAAKSVGVDIWRYKIYSYLYGSVWASLAGAVFAAKLTIVSPESFSFEQSFFALAAVIIGGVGGVAGSFLGGAVYILISEGLAGSYATLSGVIFAAAMLLMILLRPKGLLPARALFARAALPRRASRVTGVDSEARERAKGIAVAETKSVPASPIVPATLAADGIVVDYDGVRAVDAASISCVSGQVVALIGANGAGKTSLLNAISGLAPIGQGTVELLGEGRKVNLTRRAAHVRARYGVARTFQSPRMSGGLAVWENVVQGVGSRRRRRGTSASLGARAPMSWAEALDAVGLSGRANFIASDLPYGDQRLCEIARAIVAGPSFLLMDEPSSGLNDTETTVLSTIIRDLAERSGLGIIMVEHDMDLVRSAADRVVALQLGVVIAEGTPKEVLTDPAVRRNYLGE
jgi:branched-chain amino acid transport system permease protein